MAGGGGGGNAWIGCLVGGGILVAIAAAMHGSEGALVPALQAIGGLLVVFGSCEAMILSVEGLGARMGWNAFVAGTLAGLASNVPEIVMLGFVVLKDPRVAFVVVALTLHVGAMAFGLYCGLLPRDARGHARLPAPMVKLSTDLYACAGVIFLAMGSLMVLIRSFESGNHKGEGLGVGDLYVLGGCLLFVEVVAVFRLIKNYAKDEPDDEKAQAKTEAPKPEEAKTPEAEAEAKAEVLAEALEEAATQEAGDPKPDRDTGLEALPEVEVETSAGTSWKSIAAYGCLGVATSVVGGHAVGEFAEALVKGVTGAGYSEMIGAILLSVFACSGVFVMIAMAHMKGKYDLALSNTSGAVTQVPFVVMPLVMILMAAFAQTGKIPTLPDGSVLAIDFATTSAVFFGFPTMLLMWKSIQDDGKVNWLETASMVGLFVVILYFLGAHG